MASSNTGKKDSRPDIPPDKSVTIRCPRLGHQIYFAYCFRENSGLPCFKTIDCWYSHFKVDEYLKQKLAGDEFRKVFSPSAAPKMVSLLDLIEQAKKRRKEKS
jgi:hypothetical protein